MNINYLKILLFNSQFNEECYKAWIIDQIARAVEDNNYQDFIKKYNTDGYCWDEGIAPSKIVDNVPMTKIEWNFEKLDEIDTILWRWSQFDGAHHKAWAIDQIARVTYSDSYQDFIKEYNQKSQYCNWDVGIAP